jgi:small conductance mechanosensitive channel
MDVLERAFDKINWDHVWTALWHIGLILVVAWVAMLAAKFALRRLESVLIRRGEVAGEVATESRKRAETLAHLLEQAVLVLLWVMAVLVILLEIGVEIAPLIAGAGIVGLAVGFGAQNLVKDVISGFFMILENQIRVGDVVTVNGIGGLVEMITLRTILLRDLSGTVHIIPNGAINTLANSTYVWSAYVLDIGVAYKENTDRVIDVLRAVSAELRGDPRFGSAMLEDIEVFGVDKFDESAVVIKARLKTLASKQWEVGREYRRRLKQAFDREGIEIPFPHRAIQFSEASKPFLAEVRTRQPASA